MKVEEFLNSLNSHSEQIPLEDLKDLLNELSLSIDEIPDQVKFAEDKYQRNLLRLGPIYYALVLCWGPGQESPVHDHLGATCGVKVLSGGGVEYRYEKDKSGKLVKCEETALSEGMICGSEGGDIHLIRNNTQENLVSLHIYSPYLSNFNIYNMETGAVEKYQCPLVEELESKKAALKG